MVVASPIPDFKDEDAVEDSDVVEGDLADRVAEDQQVSNFVRAHLYVIMSLLEGYNEVREEAA